MTAPPPIRFSAEEAYATDWRFNCGPGALCAVLGMTPAEIRPHMLDFERKGYTNPTLMLDVLRGLGVAFRHRPDRLWPEFGLVRVQWSGPWTAPGVPPRVAYRHTHWVASCGTRLPDSMRVFDVNAICVGGWLSFIEWAQALVPWLLRICEPKADGRWWVTHALELTRGPDGYATRRAVA